MAILAAVGTARRVIAVDGIAERRELAALLGAQPVEPAEAQAAVAEATDGMGADVVIEAAGSPGALDASLRLARGRGTISVVGAHFEPDYPLNNALMFERDPTPVITHRMPLADAAEAYRLFDERSATKVVLTP
jgi:threonine dehydrogenase-like Zn-dependent dehydrogenase